MFITYLLHKLTFWITRINNISFIAWNVIWNTSPAFIVLMGMIAFRTSSCMLGDALFAGIHGKLLRTSFWSRNALWERWVDFGTSTELILEAINDKVLDKGGI
jgi:hypothetical protein